MKIATWNINSIRARLGHVLRWLEEHQPDVLLLQELKVTTETMPRDLIEDLGYTLHVVGQKTYNGVAILSKSSLEDVVTCLPGDPEDTAARYVQAFVQGWCVASVYVPNGQNVGSAPYTYKLRFFERLRQHLKSTLEAYPRVIVGGDFNVAPADQDVCDPDAWHDQVLCSPKEREAFCGLLDLGLTDGFRHHHPQQQGYTWWDYRGASFRRNRGLRIDHILLSRPEDLVDVGVDVEPRRWERPSDHTPVWCHVKV